MHYKEKEYINTSSGMNVTSEQMQHTVNCEPCICECVIDEERETKEKKIVSSAVRVVAISRSVCDCLCVYVVHSLFLHTSRTVPLYRYTTIVRFLLFYVCVYVCIACYRRRFMDLALVFASWIHTYLHIIVCRICLFWPFIQSLSAFASLSPVFV